MYQEFFTGLGYLINYLTKIFSIIVCFVFLVFFLSTYVFNAENRKKGIFSTIKAQYSGMFIAMLIVNFYVDINYEPFCRGINCLYFRTDALRAVIFCFWQSFLSSSCIAVMTSDFENLA